MANWLGALQGLLGGAGSGGALGSIFPGIGTAIGAGLGGIGGGLAGLFGGGESSGVEQTQNFTPEQQSILQFLLQQGQQGLQNPYEGFEPIAQQAQSQFNQQTVPSLAERFAGMGHNALSSGAFASQLGQAGAGLQENLAALQSQYGMQNRQNALQQLQLGLRPQFENTYRPGFGSTLLAGAAQSAPSFYQSYMLNNALNKSNNSPKR